LTVSVGNQTIELCIDTHLSGHVPLYDSRKSYLDCIIYQSS